VAEPIRYYFDQHLWASVAQGLRGKGIDVLTTQDAGRCGLSDPDQLSLATAEERVVATFDTDYLALHQSGVHHAGVVWCPAQKYGIGGLIQALLLVHAVLDRESMRDHVEYL
jgi:hypothetical protein